MQPKHGHELEESLFLGGGRGDGRHGLSERCEILALFVTSILDHIRSGVATEIGSLRMRQAG